MTHSALLRSPAVFRFRVYLGTALALSAIAATLVNAQLTDEEKKKRKAREEMRAVASPTPAETPEPSAKPKPATRKSKTRRSPTPTPKPTATAKKSSTLGPDESPTPKPKPKSEAQKSDGEEEGTPKLKAKTEATKSPEPTADKKTPKPEADKSPKPKATSGAKKSDTEEEATPKAKAKPADSPEPTKSSAAKKSPTPKADKSPTPKKKPGKKKPIKKKPSAKKGATPKPKASEKAEPTKTPSATATPAKPAASESARPPISEPFVVPRATPPPPPPPQAALPSDITIEKSGLEQEQGFEPPPPPPRRRGFWPWSRQISYRYLTSANIEAIRRAPVQRARWKFIIVHNSGTRQGNARAFDYYHRKVRRMRNGMAYHFVIGNGTSSRNGGIEIGDRWRRQVNGGHVHSDYMNNIGLGICLVGDFNRDQPTRAQLEATEELIRYLQERCGKSDGRAPMVRPHREVNPPRWATDCPGDAFPYGWFGRFR